MKTVAQRGPTKAQKNASSPNNSVWVSANAGSGKTQVLVDRVIKLLLAGAEPSTILCITFTKAAAAEMSLRLFGRLSSWTSLDEQRLVEVITELGMQTDSTVLTRARRLFTLALETPGGLKIQTIHGFCERLLQLFPVEAGLAPGFSVIDEYQAQEIRDSAIAELLLDPDHQPAIVEALEEAKALVGNIEDFSDLIVRFLRVISKNTAFRSGQLQRLPFEGALKVLLNLDPLQSAYDLRHEILTIDRARFAHFGRLLMPFGSFKGQKTPELLVTIEHKEDCFDDLCRLFLTGKSEPFVKMISNDAAKKHPDALQFLEEQQDRFYKAYCRFGTSQRVEASGAIFEISNVVRQHIEDAKQRGGFCDFDDLIEKAAELLTGKDATRWVLKKLDEGLNHILVDEAQDTSPAQWQIIRSLADEFFAGGGRELQHLRTMFVVGDRKQSIYSFQGADLQTYSETRQYLTEQLDRAGKNFTEETLGLSFRSAQEILSAVDLVFPFENLEHMGIDSSGPLESPHSSARTGIKGIVELWPLVISERRDREEGEAWEAPVDQLSDTHHRRLLARKIAATLKNWIGRRNLSGEERPVVPGDILILLQSRTGLFPLLLAEMRRAGLPVAGADRLTLQKSLAVQDLMAFVQWCLLPEDDYSLACLLKSPIVPQAISEDELFDLAFNRGKRSLWAVLSERPSANVNLLAEFQVKAAISTAADFLHQILNIARKRIVQRLGSEAREATDALLDLAYDFDATQGGGLFAFLGWYEKNQTTLKREMEQTTDHIRVMSVHAAKGLEANIVILPDATYLATGDQQLRLLKTGETSRFPSLPLWNLGGLPKNDELQVWIDEDQRRNREERNRLLYVAMTRARNELYITGSSSGRSLPEHCWWTRLELSLGEAFQNEPTLVKPYGGVATGASLSQEESLPTWMLEPIPQSERQPKPAVTHKVLVDSEAVRHGTALHLLMQKLVDMKREARGLASIEIGKLLQLHADDVEKILALFARPDLEAFWSYQGRSEVDIWSPDAKSETGTYRIDRLVLGDTETLILDYKSGIRPNEKLAPSHPYVLQLAGYCRALSSAVPGKPVRAALLWLESGELDWLSETQLSRSLD
jgi:ATP-dependent helicase/nuclease subunit A